MTVSCLSCVIMWTGGGWCQEFRFGRAPLFYLTQTPAAPPTGKPFVNPASVTVFLVKNER
jgi:hypothetical protein